MIVDRLTFVVPRGKVNGTFDYYMILILLPAFDFGPQFIHIKESSELSLFFYKALYYLSTLPNHWTCQ